MCKVLPVLTGLVIAGQRDQVKVSSLCQLLGMYGMYIV